MNTYCTEQVELLQASLPVLKVYKNKAGFIHRIDIDKGKPEVLNKQPVCSIKELRYQNYIQHFSSN